MQGPQGQARLNKVKEVLADNLRWTLQSLGNLSGRTALLDDDKYVVLQVGKAVFSQAPRHMRVELWLSSLQRKGVGTAAAAKYADMLRTPIGDEASIDIDKDLARTFPNTRRFAAAEGQAALRRVLRAYAAYDPEVGYCQGMNFVAGLLLMYMPGEAHAFGALVMLMEDRGLRKYYSVDMSLLQTHLWQLGRLMSPPLCAHLESVGVLPMLYAASWLMTCFSADFPYSFSARVMDVIMADKMDQALLKAAVHLLGRAERRLTALNDLEDVLTYIKQELPAWDEQSLHDTLTEAFAMPWTPRQLALLGSTEGAESVSEALERVQRNLVLTGGEDGPISPDSSRQGGPSSTEGSVPKTPRDGTGRQLGSPAGATSIGRAALLPPPPAVTPSRRLSSSSSRGASPLPSRNASSSETMQQQQRASATSTSAAVPAAAAAAVANFDLVAAPATAATASFPPSLSANSETDASFLAAWDPFGSNSYDVAAVASSAATTNTATAGTATAGAATASAATAGITAAHGSTASGQHIEPSDPFGLATSVGSMALGAGADGQQRRQQPQQWQERHLQACVQRGVSTSSQGDWLEDEQQQDWGDFAAARKASASLPPVTVVHTMQQPTHGPKQQQQLQQLQQQRQQHWPQEVAVGSMSPSTSASVSPAASPAQQQRVQQQQQEQQWQPGATSSTSLSQPTTSPSTSPLGKTQQPATTAHPDSPSAQQASASPFSVSPSVSYQAIHSATPSPSASYQVLPQPPSPEQLPFEQLQQRLRHLAAPQAASSPSMSYQALPQPPSPQQLPSKQLHQRLKHLAAPQAAGSPSASYQVLPDGTEQQGAGDNHPSTSQHDAAWDTADWLSAGAFSGAAGGSAKQCAGSGGIGTALAGHNGDFSWSAFGGGGGAAAAAAAAAASGAGRSHTGSAAAGNSSRHGNAGWSAFGGGAADGGAAAVADSAAVGSSSGHGHAGWSAFVAVPAFDAVAAVGAAAGSGAGSGAAAAGSMGHASSIESFGEWTAGVGVGSSGRLSSIASSALPPASPAAVSGIARGGVASPLAGQMGPHGSMSSMGSRGSMGGVHGRQHSGSMSNSLPPATRDHGSVHGSYANAAAGVQGSSGSFGSWAAAAHVAHMASAPFGSDVASNIASVASGSAGSVGSWTATGPAPNFTTGASHIASVPSGSDASFGSWADAPGGCSDSSGYSSSFTQPAGAAGSAAVGMSRLGESTSIGWQQQRQQQQQQQRQQQQQQQGERHLLD